MGHGHDRGNGCGDGRGDAPAPRRGRRGLLKAAGALAAAAVLAGLCLAASAHAGGQVPGAAAQAEALRAGTGPGGAAPGADEHAGWSTQGSVGTVRNRSTGRDELLYPHPARLAVVVGDSQADGAAGVPGERTWPRLALRAAGYQVVYRGRGGTGFTAANGKFLNYVDALRSGQWLLPHGNVGLVLVEGGGNDARAGATDERIRAGFLDLVAELRRTYPESRIVAVGTLARAAHEGGGRRNAVDAAVGRAAREAGVDFIAAGDWLTTAGLAARLADGTHLDAEGHRIAADLFGQRLAGLGVGGPLDTTSALAAPAPTAVPVPTAVPAPTAVPEVP
ncbi:hypothetical protein NCCP1664_02820 [Zafaria cholistanensis]|uniref:SGNH hydrolase-type esterase domain-containing protein n=1 Tax=Zafaria cholistanensis TaxID=1682741 RepID=A0A5A7NLK7_9MICC|nr:SGNH/GDSL hydrolase family protein [Zafaria cholistanensis]GER21785.1 hypothetical protein NCCP1664_02820 [Zafaria cholistanensis]